MTEKQEGTEVREIWTITVMKKSEEMVAFNKPVTANEAYKLYLSEDFEDVVDSVDLDQYQILSIG